MAKPNLSNIKERLWPRGGGREVWMIVDGARDRRIFGMLLDSYLTYSCLYHGDIAIRRHLRKLLSVRGPKGEILLFRYYDPRVLRAYLPTCRPEELETVFGPIDRFWLEDDTPETILEFRFDRGKLLRTEFPALENAEV